MAKKILSLVLALAMVSSFACISAFAADAQPLVFNVAGAKTLDLDGDLVANGCDGAILVENGAELTINGKDENLVKGLACPDDGFSMAVFARGEGTVVTINGGSYENELDTMFDRTHVDLIYAKEGANVVITGGTFKCATPQWTLNCHDTLGATITVMGGKFYQFDPSNANEKVAPAGKTEIVVPAEYAVVKNGDWYEVVSKADTKELTLSGALEANGCDGAIWAKNGAKLTINGADTNLVKGLACPEDGFSMAVYALGQGTEVVINGGYYENELDTKVDETHVDLIYAKDGASITINGGTFKCATPQWTLNCHDTFGATITVMGGKFYQFDPSNANEKVAPAGKTEIVVPEGYSVVQNGDWYEVVEANITFDSASSVEDGEKGALRFVFNVSIPDATKTYFGAYMIPLNIFQTSGVAKAVQVQYDTEVATSSTFSADLVEIPFDHFETNIYTIPYIKTANGVVTFTGASASVNSALAE